MKKILSMILCVCLLLCSTALAEEADENTFLLKVWDKSGEKISYLKFDFYEGDRLAGRVLSCPNEGEDFYRAPYSPASPEEPVNLRIECSYAVSELEPEDAILQAMAGNPAEEHPMVTLEMKPELGQEYQLELVKDGDSWAMIPVEESPSQHQ